jgi:hypothetical protein
MQQASKDHTLVTCDCCDKDSCSLHGGQAEQHLKHKHSTMTDQALKVRDKAAKQKEVSGINHGEFENLRVGTCC